MGLIDTDAAYAVLTDYYHHSTDTQHAALKEALGRVETVDAVEVVRCKNCKYWRRDTDHTCKEHSLVSPMLADGFCSRGERKEGTMGRLIDADVLLSEMEKYSDDSARSKNEYLFGMQQRLETCIKLIEDAPTVDAVPVRHGRWVRWHEETYDSFGVAYVPHCKCSECRMKFDPYIANYMNYCSNCGAKLDRKDGDHHEG